MSAADISERIRQKAVTLVGGGINSSITSTTKSEATKLRKRRRQEWTDVESALNYGIETTAENEKSPGGDDAIRFLLQLNSSWNKYISDLLKITEVSEDELTTVKSRFISARSKVELIGAHVRVATCNQKKHLVNSYGVIIGETKNTWKIVAREVLKQSRKRAKPEDEDSQSDAKNGINCKVIVLPKRGSSLVLIIPIISSLSKGDSEVLCGGDGEQNHQLIAKSEKSLRITLDPNLNEEY